MHNTACFRSAQANSGGVAATGHIFSTPKLSKQNAAVAASCGAEQPILRPARGELPVRPPAMLIMARVQPMRRPICTTLCQGLQVALLLLLIGANACGAWVWPPERVLDRSLVAGCCMAVATNVPYASGTHRRRRRAVAHRLPAQDRTELRPFSSRGGSAAVAPVRAIQRMGDHCSRRGRPSLSMATLSTTKAPSRSPGHRPTRPSLPTQKAPHPRHPLRPPPGLPARDPRVNLAHLLPPKRFSSAHPHL